MLPTLKEMQVENQDIRERARLDSRHGNFNPMAYQKLIIYWSPRTTKWHKSAQQIFVLCFHPGVSSSIQDGGVIEANGYKWKQGTGWPTDDYRIHKRLLKGICFTFTKIMSANGHSSGILSPTEIFYLWSLKRPYFVYHLWLASPPPLPLVFLFVFSCVLIGRRGGSEK